MSDPFDEIRRRLESLECQNRRLRRWGGSALVAALSLGALGLAAAQEVPKVLKTEKLEVVDERGTLRFCLIPGDGQAGAYMGIYNGKGENRFSIATGDTLGCILTMYGRGDGSESPGVMLRARPGDGMPALAIVSPKSAASAELTFEEADVPCFSLNDKNGKPVFKAVGKPNAALVLGSSTSEARAELGFESGEKPQITLRDKSGKVTFKAAK